MFYTKAEKKAIQEAISAIEQRLFNLELHAETVKVHIQAVTKMYLDKTPIKITAPILAPYGFKKDGTPKKRPGRPLKSQKGN